MLKLVLVSSHAIVSRTFEEDNQEIIREIPGDTEMMRQVLVIDGENVIFESSREDRIKKPTLAALREMLANKNVIRRLGEREKLALSRVQYFA